MKLWFYVPDYPKVTDKLFEGYAITSVVEWSAEPGRVGGCPDDADVTVAGSEKQVAHFREWLKSSKIEGLMIEGEDV